MEKTTILIVEDEAIVAEDLTGKLKQLGYEVAGIATRGEEAVDLAGSIHPNLVLMDILLAGRMDGIETAEVIRSQFDVPVIYLTAHSDPATLTRAKLTGPFGYILKPFEERELSTNIEMAILKYQSDLKMRQQRDELEARTKELQAANEALRSSRTAALNLMDDAISARERAEQLGLELRKEIGERKRTENALRESQERLDMALRAGCTFAFEWKPLTDAVVRSANCEEIIGLEGDAATYDTGRDFFQRIHPEDRDPFISRIKSLTPEQSIYSVKYRFLKRDGEMAVLEETAQGVFDGKGQLIKLYGMTSDVTERTRAEEALMKSREKDAILSEAAGRLLSTKDPEKLIDSLSGKIMEHIDCQVFFNFMADEEAKRLRLNAYAGIPPDAAKGIAWIDYGTAVCGTVAREGKRIVCESIQEREDAMTDVVRSLGIRAYVCHPLLSQDKVIGTISFGTRTKNSFTDEEISLMKTTADQISIALERYDFQKRLLRYSEELENEVRERTEKIREQAEILDSLFRYTITPLVLFDREFNFIRVNQEYANVCAKKTDEFYGHNHFEFYPHEENELIFRNVVETKVTYQVSAKPFVFPDHPEWGTTYWDWTLTPLLDGNGEVNFLIFSLLDVTERVKAQERIKIERNRLRTILDTMPDGILIVGMDHEIQYINPALERDFGPVSGQKCYRYFHGIENPCSWCKNSDVMSGKTVHDEWIYKKTGGIYEILSTPFVNADGSISKMQIFHDITKRKKAEETVKIERQRLFSVMEQLPAYVCLLSEDYTFSFVNKEFKRRFGDPGNRKCHEYLFGLQKPCEGCQTFRILTERLSANQWEWTGPDGNTYAIFDYPFTDIDGTAKILEMGLDITKRKKAEESLRQSENRYRLLIEQASEGIALLTQELEIIEVNPMACQIIGYSYEELIGAQGQSLLYPEELTKILPALDLVLSGETIVLEVKAKRKDGIPVVLDLSAKVIESDMIQVLFRDITERRERESRIHVTDTLLGLFAKTTSRQEYLQSVVQVIHDWSGCRCVGIRVASSKGYIPYEAYTGFSQEFWQLENMISLNKDMCACIRTVTGQFERQDASVLTPQGSVCINNSQEFLNSLTEEEITRFRGNCIRSGFLSIALIPIRYRGSTIGLVHLADEHEGKTPLRGVQFLESVSSLIGEAIHRFNTEEALRKSEARLNEAQGIAHIGNWDWNIETNELSWSDEIYRIFEVSRDQFGKTYEAVLDFIHPDDRQAVQEAVTGAFFERKPYSVVHRIIPSGGGEKTVQEQGEIIFDHNEVPLRIVGTIQDVTEQKKTEEQLRASQEQLRNLFAHLQTIREKEREKIAREIHDEFGTMLTALKIDISWLEKKVARAHPDTVERLHKDLELLSSSIKTVQRISSELRPGILDHLGLAAATEWQVKEFANRMGIKWRVDIDMQSTDLDRDLSISVFRILQESLTNIARHASASSVWVTLKERGHAFHMEITDDGRGITDDQLANPQSFGLIGIRERVEHMGGEVEIGRPPKGGTTVSIRIPVGQGVVK